MQLIPRYKDENLDIDSKVTLLMTVNGGPPVVEGTYAGTQMLNNRYLLGYNIPEFHSRVRRGELLPKTPYQQFHLFGTSSGVYDVWHQTTKLQHTYPAENKYFYVGDEWKVSEEELQEYIPVVRPELCQRAAANIATAGHDTLTFIAELKPTIQMFKNLVTRILSRDIPRNKRMVGSDWMEGRYGYRTLIYDLQDLNESIKKLSKARKDRVSKNSKFLDSNSSEEAWITNHVIGTRHHTRSTNVEICEIGSVTADIFVPAFFANPILTAWELVPYSFVIDWLINVGQAIGALTFLTMSRSFSASWGYKISIHRQYQRKVASWNASYWGQNYESCSCNAVLTYRYPVTISRQPQINLRLDTSKVVDLLVMLSQRLR